jgi:dolichol-phosphate mannosyltransferase
MNDEFKPPTPLATPQNPEISVVIPILNEEGNLSELYDRLTMIFDVLKKSHEIIFIDDGSKDRSIDILKELHEKDKRVKIIKFSRNFGHHIALSAGLDFCKGAIVVMMDADLQDRPEDVPHLVSEIEQGCDIAYAIRKSHESPLFDKITSKFFYRIFGKLTRINIARDAGTFRAMRRNVVDVLKNFSERSRFMPGLIDWTGFKSTGVKVEREKRSRGKRKYNLWKRLKLAVTAVISFSHFPLQIAGYLGFIVAALSFLWAIYLVMRKLIFGIPLFGYTSLIVSIFFLAGVQLIVLGFIGEYLGKVFIEVQKRPLYVVEEVIE